MVLLVGNPYLLFLLLGFSHLLKKFFVESDLHEGLLLGLKLFDIALHLDLVSEVLLLNFLQVCNFHEIVLVPGKCFTHCKLELIIPGFTIIFAAVRD